MGTFMASSIIPAYSDITQKLGVSMQQASYLTSLQIAVLGGAPLFWKPLSNRFGRRPIFLLSLICSLVCNVGCAKSPDYASTAACRALAAFFISPASAIGSAVVMETTFKRDRARYMGVWTLMVTLGVPSGPFIFGFVAYRAGYQWIYWVLAIVSYPVSDCVSRRDDLLTGMALRRSTEANSCSIFFLAQKHAIWVAVPTVKKAAGRRNMSISDASIRHR